MSGEQALGGWEQRLLSLAGALLPREVREDQLNEWRDELESAQESGLSTGGRTLSIVTRSAPRLAWRAHLDAWRNEPLRRSDATGLALSWHGETLATGRELGLFFGSMALSIWAYAWIFGVWWFAFGLVALIAVHEMGHFFALHRENLESSPPVFIPFLGAVIVGAPGASREQEARVGYAGPLAGAIGTGAVLLAALATSGELRTDLLVLSCVSAAINLVNFIIPIRPLDGGWVAQMIGDRMKYVGLAVLPLLMVWLEAPGFLVFLIFIVEQSALKWRWKVTAAIALYVALAICIVLGLGGPRPFAIDLVYLCVLGAFTAWMFREALQSGEAWGLSREIPDDCVVTSPAHGDQPAFEGSKADAVERARALLQPRGGGVIRFIDDGAKRVVRELTVTKDGEIVERALGAPLTAAALDTKPIERSVRLKWLVRYLYLTAILIGLLALGLILLPPHVIIT